MNDWNLVWEKNAIHNLTKLGQKEQEVCWTQVANQLHWLDLLQISPDIASLKDERATLDYQNKVGDWLGSADKVSEPMDFRMVVDLKVK